MFYSCFVHSRFSEAYRRECLATAVNLLEKICRGVKPTSYNQNYLDIPVACMNLVASVSDFVHCNKQQVCEVNLIRQAGCIQIKLNLAFLKDCTNNSHLGDTRRGKRATICKRCHPHHEKLDQSLLQTEFVQQGYLILVQT